MANHLSPPTGREPLDGDDGDSGGTWQQCGSPADAFFAAFNTAAVGVRFADVTNDTHQLMHLAEAFRDGESAASEWIQGRWNWSPAASRNAAQTLALAAGDWLLAGKHGASALLTALRLAQLP